MSGLGLPFCPNVPLTAGVPAVPRIPSYVLSQVTSNLNGAAQSMTSAAVSAVLTPSAPQSSVLEQVTNANGLVSGASTLLNSYSSALFNQYAPQVTALGGTINTIMNGIQSSPTDPLSDISDTLSDTSAQLDTTASDFSSDLADTTGTDTLIDSSNVSESITVTATQNSTQWGILDSGGNSVLQGGDNSNFVDLEYKQDYVIADYPIEQGGFESYDKVQMPFDARVTVSCGGSVDDRQAFLASIQAIVGDTNLYSVAMPEATFSSVNIQHIDFLRKNTNGLGILIVRIYLLEIRETAEVSFVSNSQGSTPASADNVASPGAAATSNNGAVQAVAASAAQQSAAFLNLGTVDQVPLFQ